MVIAAGNPTPLSANALRQFVHYLGLVFQMQDDYLDLYDNGKQLGKGRASDVANQKTTFATLYNQQELSSLITQYFQQAQESLSIFTDSAYNLRELVNYLRCRTELQPNDGINIQ